MSIDPNDVFNKLMARASLSAIGVPEALRRIGTLVDLARDLDREDGIVRALTWCDELSQKKLTRRQEAQLDYFRANAWGNRQSSKYRNVDLVWKWEQFELQQQILYLRRSLLSPGFNKLSPRGRCQIFTNLGNQLSTIGRFVEARSAWTRALAINPDFGMALGNRGAGLVQYARGLYDPGHKRVFLHFAYQDLKSALSAKARYGGYKQQDAKAFFAEEQKRNEAKPPGASRRSSGKSRWPTRTRRWGWTIPKRTPARTLRKTRTTG